MKGVRTWPLAIGSLAALILGAALPAGAQSQGSSSGATGAAGNSSGGAQSSGGPGGLGTEVPLDSQAARNYFNYSLPNDTAEARRIQDGIQKLHAEYQGIVRSAAQAEADPGISADAKRSAEQLRQDAQRDDQRLVQVAQDGENMDVSGPAYDARLHQIRDGHDRSTGSSSASGQSSLSETVRLSQRASSDANQLEKQARKDSRQQLASFLDSAKKTSSTDASKVASAAGTSATGTGSGQ